jgi:hypothetical protein
MSRKKAQRNEKKAEICYIDPEEKRKASFFHEICNRDLSVRAQSFIKGGRTRKP